MKKFKAGISNQDDAPIIFLLIAIILALIAYKIGGVI